jgi:hypothetical protein
MPPSWRCRRAFWGSIDVCLAAQASMAIVPLRRRGSAARTAETPCKRSPTRDNGGYHAFSNSGGGVKPSVRFLVRLGAVSLPHPDTPLAPRAAAVKDGRRPPPARSVLDGGEHGADPGIGRARVCRCVPRLTSVMIHFYSYLLSLPAEVMVLSEVGTRPPHHGLRE